MVLGFGLYGWSALVEYPGVRLAAVSRYSDRASQGSLCKLLGCKMGVWVEWEIPCSARHSKILMYRMIPMECFVCCLIVRWLIAVIIVTTTTTGVATPDLTDSLLSKTAQRSLLNCLNRLFLYKSWPATTALTPASSSSALPILPLSSASRPHPR